MISVIVPMYNTIQYIKRCVDSILKCDFTDIEIIIVNDGSSDGCGELCKKLYGNETNVILVEQENHGVSHARNVGMTVASGEWITFVDSDDYISEEYFCAFDVHSGYDLLIMDLYKDERAKHDFSECVCRYEKEDITEIIARTIKCEQLVSNGRVTLRGPVCKIYRSAIINKYNIRFPENITMGEDELFNIEYISHCRVITYINHPVYIYEKRKGSITRSYKKNIEQCNDLFNRRLRELLINQGRWEELKWVYYDNVLSGIIYVLGHGIFCKENSARLRDKKIKCANLRKNKINSNALAYLWKFGGIKRKIVLQIFRFRLYNVIAIIFSNYNI